MNTKREKRLTMVAQAIGSISIPTSIKRAAFDRLKQAGEFPEDDRLSDEVYRRVMRNYDGWHDGPFDWSRALDDLRMAVPRAEDPVLDPLLFEAAYGDLVERFAAREVLRIMAMAGIDVTATPYAGMDLKLPQWGPLGMRLLGFPGLLARRPYARQAKRLFARAERLSERAPRARQWLAAVEDAGKYFFSSGALPADETMMEAVLNSAEMMMLMWHLRGVDVREPMALLDEVGRTRGGKRKTALANLQRRAAEGMFDSGHVVSGAD